MTTSYVDQFAPTYLGAEDLPYVPLTPYTDRVFLKLLHVNYVSGEAQYMMKAPGGEDLGVHDHYGPLVVYTVQGSWRYLEHDWVARPGDFVYEVADSRHTFIAEPGDEVILFISLQGSFAFIGPDDEIIGIETAHTLARRYEQYCRDNGLPIVDLAEFARH